MCVQCRTRVCSECSTKVEGINYCVRCLAGLAKKGGRARAALERPRTGAALLQLGAYFVVLSLALLALLEVFLPGG